METTSTHTGRRLYKSRQNRMIDGICGGIAEYFGVDPTIVRILWILITLLGGSGIILYIIAMIIMPVNPEHIFSTSTTPPAALNADKKRYWGIVLILVGGFVLMSNLGWFADFDWWSFSSTVVFPVLLILAGGLFIYIHTRKPEAAASTAQAPGEPATQSSDASAPRVRELRRSITDKKICGVCGGLAAYFNLDSTLVRILFVILILASVGWGLLLYIILCILVPEERLTTFTTQG